MLFGTNWFDWFVLAALIYGIWSGVRGGLSGEIIRVLGLLLMVGLALGFYESAGKRLQELTGLVEELANLAAFLSIAIAVYVVSLVIRLVVRRRMKKARFSAAMENIGGAAAGLLRMLALMIAVTVGLTLMRSPVWHEQIARRSVFGSFVVQRFPAVAAMAEKNFPEKMWFMKDLKRREDPNVEESGGKK